MNANGGVMTLDDLAAYEPMSYEAESYTYRGFEYVTGGNVTVVEALNILELFDPKGMEPGSPEFVHVMMEAMRLAWADTSGPRRRPEDRRVALGRTHVEGVRRKEGPAHRPRARRRARRARRPLGVRG